MTETKSGSCLCGHVTYEIQGKLRPVCACHCNQCRKSSGHYVAATQCKSKDLAIKGDSLKWYKSSDTAERGFCGTCGSNLFWRRFGNENTSIFAGTIDGPSGVVIDSQIMTETKGDYYELPNVPIRDQAFLT